MMIHGILAAAPNPFDGVSPDFSVFGVEFNSAWKKLLGAAWGLAFVLAGFGAVRAVLELQSARRKGFQYAALEHAEAAKRTVLVLIVLAGLGIVFGAVLALV